MKISLIGKYQIGLVWQIQLPKFNSWTTKFRKMATFLCYDLFHDQDRYFESCLLTIEWNLNLW